MKDQIKSDSIKVKSIKVTSGLLAKKSKKNLINEKKQATLAAIVDSSDDAIISKTLNGIITSWNQSAKKMFGFTEKEAIGKHISIIIPDDRIQEETMIIESVRSGKKIDHFETIRKAKDGTEIHISLAVSPIKNSAGKIIGASKIARNIPFRIEAEKQREIYTQKLQELNKYKDEFMVMASHELKTPVTVILANLEILKEIMGKDNNIGFVDKTLKQAVKLSLLIGNLLDVSKIQSGKLELDLSVFNLNLLVKEITDNLQRTTKNHQLIFNSNAEELMVRVDREKMGQVIINLITNAIKYMPMPGKIIIDAYRKKKNIIVSVADTGIGVPEKDLKNVFLRFYKGSGAASSFSGSGIGLFISSEIIKAHGGKIWAKSAIAKGSFFYFSLPAENNES
ncbi:MAG: ATP-binding protein [Ginsengibacter sp.]